MKKAILPALSLAVLGAAFAPKTAEAEQVAQGFASDRYNPSESGSDWLALDSLDIYGHMRLSLRVDVQYSLKPFVAETDDKTERAVVVRDSLIIHPAVSMVLWDRVRFGFMLPINAGQDGDNGRIGGTSFVSPDGTGNGDVRFSG